MNVDVVDVDVGTKICIRLEIVDRMRLPCTEGVLRRKARPVVANDPRSLIAHLQHNTILRTEIIPGRMLS